MFEVVSDNVIRMCNTTTIFEFPPPQHSYPRKNTGFQAEDSRVYSALPLVVIVGTAYHQDNGSCDPVGMDPVF